MTHAISDPVVVVTGGAGFLGDALLTELLRDDALVTPREVRVLDPSPSRHAGASRVVWHRGDVRRLEDVRAACRGADLVLHCAAVVDWGRQPASLLEAVNVGGTDNVIAACRAEGVGALVHTSTLDVVYTGRPLLDGDETLPYPRRFANGYCRTKTEAERRALASDGAPLERPGRGGAHELHTVVIRPASIFGEGDPYHVPPLVEMARRGALFRIGDGRAKSQLVYVGNVAHAHVLAARALLRGEAHVHGQVYFVTDREPANFFAFLAPFVEAAGARIPERRLPRAPLRALGAWLELMARLLRPVVRYEPVLTRFAVDFVSLDFTVRSDRAARELGYAPRYGDDEAVTRTKDYFRRRYEAGAGAGGR